MTKCKGERQDSVTKRTKLNVRNKLELAVQSFVLLSCQRYRIFILPLLRQGGAELVR